MITKILSLQSPYVGQSFEKNASLEYEEDGETEIVIFFSQEQALDVLKKRTRGMRVSELVDHENAVKSCGLPVESDTEQQVIKGSAALLLRATREALRHDVLFASDPRARIRIIFMDLGECGYVGALFAVDWDTARHVHIVHSKAQCREALRLHRETCTTGVIHQLVQSVDESFLPETAKSEPVHIEHDAASYLGTHIEFTWCVQNGKIKLPTSTPAALP